MIRDVAETYNTEQSEERGQQYRELRDRSGFRVDIPRQFSYMLTPQFAMTRRYLGMVANMRQRYRDMITYQFRFNIKFCMDNTFDNEMRRQTVTDAMNLANAVHQTILDMNNYTNDLNLQIPMFYSRSFYGLYEIPNDRVGEGQNLMDVIFSGPERHLPVLSRYNRYVPDFATFVQRDYTKALNVFTNTDPEHEETTVAREVEQFEEASVITSPGISLNAIERLLGTHTDNTKKILYVRWTFRLALHVSLSSLDLWLRNVNLSSTIPNTSENVGRWREFLNLR